MSASLAHPFNKPDYGGRSVVERYSSILISKPSLPENETLYFELLDTEIGIRQKLRLAKIRKLNRAANFKKHKLQPCDGPTKDGKSANYFCDARD